MRHMRVTEFSKGYRTMQSTSRSLFARCRSTSLSYVIFNIFLSCLPISASTAAYHDESPSAGAPWPEHSPTSRYSSRTMLFFTAREKGKRFKPRALARLANREEGPDFQLIRAARQGKRGCRLDRLFVNRHMFVV